MPNGIFGLYLKHSVKIFNDRIPEKITETKYPRHDNTIHAQGDSNYHRPIQDNLIKVTMEFF